MSVVIGWDIGGAHLKAARADGSRVIDAVQIASPLRLGLDRLAAAFNDVKAMIGSAPLNVVTMTGELADTFASRSAGVESLVDMAVRQIAPDTVLIYAGRAGFIKPEQASNRVADIASANWHASAGLVGRWQRSALFVDVGSTTTDIVPVSNGRVAARGYTDPERLAAGELVYSGLTRSFLMATADPAPFAGAWTTLINENFANMADVHRILETLPDGADQMTTADGRDKTIVASRARLARMVGRDASDASDAQWHGLARWFAERQLRSVTDGAMLVLSQATLAADAPVVGAGIGVELIVEIARRLGREFIAFSDLIDAAPAVRDRASQCAPAAALAVLASRP